MAKIGKRIKAAREQIEVEKQYALPEAVALLKSVAGKSGAKFKASETVDIAIRLGIDTKRQTVRGVCGMPSGTGKTTIVGVVCGDDKTEEAKASGADFVWGDDFVEVVQNDGVPNVDRLIATPDMMATLGKVGRQLGPKGLMPNPKTGTVTKDITAAVKSAKSGQVEFRADKGGNIHAGVGKVDFSADEIMANVNAVKTAILKAKPDDAKGIYVKRAFISSTMGPGIELNVASLLED